jgi:hypothetical protein
MAIKAPTGLLRGIAAVAAAAPKKAATPVRKPTAAPKPVAPPPAPPKIDPFEAMKRAFEQSELLKRGFADKWETANPFSQFFDENATKNMIAQKYQPDFTRESENLNYQDQTYRRDEADIFKNNFNVLQQNQANSGALFGGVRQFQNTDITNKRNNSLDAYAKDFTNKKFEMERNQRRLIDSQLQSEKDLKNQEWQERKRKDVANFNSSVPGYSF